MNHRALMLLQQQIQKAEALKQLPNDNSPQYKLWSTTTAKLLREYVNSDYADIFSEVKVARVPLMDEAEAERAFMHLIEDKVQLLLAILSEHSSFQADPALDNSRSPSLQTYDFHQEIKAVSLSLYEDKHYAQAVEEAFKRVIQEVKRIVIEKMGQEYDGDDLMNRAFSPQNPVIKFNLLQSSEDKDEQKGMMFLFKGIVGIRNKKAHDNVILDDPMRATEYLSLASLLMRLLDQFVA